MGGLVIELTTLVLSHLPVKSLLKFKLVSKEWYSLISSPYFINLHRHKSWSEKFLLLVIKHGNSFHVERRALDSNLTLTARFLLPETFDDKTYVHVQFVGSCHGLVVLELRDQLKRRISLSMWNPSTNDYMVLPLVQLPDTRYQYPAYYGFGYDKSTDDYKLVKLSYNNDGYYCQLVYSAKRNSWGPPLIVDTGGRYTSPCSCYPAVVDDHICHWLMFRCHSNDDGDDDDDVEFELRGFDICREEWIKTELPLPVSVMELCSDILCELGVLDNCLCLVNCDHINRSIWVMKEYGVKDSWTTLLSPGSGPKFTLAGPPIAYSDGQLLLPRSRGTGTPFWYDLKDEITIPTYHSGVESATLCAETLVSVRNPAKDGATGTSLTRLNLKKI